MKASELREIAINAQISASTEVTQVLEQLNTAASNGQRSLVYNNAISQDSENLLKELGYTVIVKTSITTILF